jgi:signal transduction histidine kinase
LTSGAEAKPLRNPVLPTRGDDQERAGQSTGLRLRLATTPPARRCLMLAVGVGSLVLIWTGIVLTVPDIRFVLISPRTKTGLEAFLAAVSLFTALVLIMFPSNQMHNVLRWVAFGFIIFGIGSLAFGYIFPAVANPPSLNTGMYASLIVRILGTAFMAIGLTLPTFRERPPPALAIGLAGTVGLGVVGVASRLPTLTTVHDLNQAAASSSGTLPGLTVTHWLLSLLPLVFAIVAAVGAIRNYCDSPLGRWLALAMVLLAGTQLHRMFWPSGFSPIFTTASVLRICYTVVIAIGIVLELRRIAAERMILHERERLHSRRLEELSAIRAEFMTTLVHELSSPLAGIDRTVELMKCEPDPARHQENIKHIESSTAALNILVEDLQESASAERHDFAVELEPVSVATLVDQAATYARLLPGSHRIESINDVPGAVMADEIRIGQVLRNLLANAVKYSPDGTSITLRAHPIGAMAVRFEVADQGPGVHPDDQKRIFEKFQRGHLPGSESHLRPPGLGVGLYVSRQILLASGSELHMHSELDVGTTFWFDLEKAT